ncbi:MAG: hypothetical protein AAF632_22385 [Bacteroidota bacterium]
MKNIIIVCSLLILAGCVSQKTSSNSDYSSSDTDYSAASTANASAASGDILGVWKISINTRIGTRTNDLTIYQEEGVYKGKTDRGNFVINRDGNELSWVNDIDSPRGRIRAQHQMTVKGDKMTGTVNASGRTLNVSGSRK